MTAVARSDAPTLRQVERVLAVVDRCLRKTFPTDYHKRCVYAAWGVQSLLNDLGYAPVAVGGDFAAFIVAQDNSRAGLAGFAFNAEQCSHFWIECGDRLIDIGPSYLPLEASYPVARMPALAWRMDDPLPAYLRYRVQMRFSPEDRLSTDPVIEARAERFVAACRARAAAQRGHLVFPTGLISGDASVRAIAGKGDSWARGALRFSAMADWSSLPF